MKTLFLCFLILFIAGPVSSKTLSYQATAAGMHLLDADITYDEPNPNYTIRMTSETKGLLSFLLGGSADFFSQGTYQNKNWTILSSQSKTMSGRKVKDRYLDFSDKPDTFDYPVLFLDALMSRELGTRSYTVFDGRRTMSVLFSYQGKINPETLDLPLGPYLDYYTVSVQIISGKRGGWFFNRMSDEKESPLHLYFQPKEGADISSLVYAAFDTAILGQITVRLVKES